MFLFDLLATTFKSMSAQLCSYLEPIYPSSISRCIRVEINEPLMSYRKGLAIHNVFAPFIQPTVELKRKSVEPLIYRPI